MICCEYRLCRELVQVGKGQAGSRETKWCLDACVALIDVAMAEEIFATIGPQTSVVTCFLGVMFQLFVNCISVNSLQWNHVLGVCTLQVSSTDLFLFSSVF